MDFLLLLVPHTNSCPGKAQCQHSHRNISHRHPSPRIRESTRDASQNPSSTAKLSHLISSSPEFLHITCISLMMGKTSEVENPSLGQKLGVALPDRTISILHLLSIPPNLLAGLCQILQQLFQFVVSHNTSWQHHFSFPTFHCSFWALSSCGSSSTATSGAGEAGWVLAQARMFHSCARPCRAGLSSSASPSHCSTFCATL